MFGFFYFLQLQLIFIHLSMWQWCKYLCFLILFVCLFLKPSYLVFISRCQGLPNNRWVACIRTTSHKTPSLYLPTENEIKTCLVTLNSSHSFQSFKLIQYNMFNSSQVQLSNQICAGNISTTTIIHNHTTYIIFYMASNMKYILSILPNIFFIDLNIKKSPYNQGFTINNMFNITTFSYYILPYSND
jgi:hypothetical protein